MFKLGSLNITFRQIKLPLRRSGLVFAALLCLLIVLRCLPKPDLAEAFPSSRSVMASNGELLRLTLASDEQYRLWTPIADIAQPLQEAVLLYEDRWFYWHPGINPFSLVKATFATNFGNRRIGGSTITMQLARRLYDLDSSTISGKVTQIFAAIWLELRYSKRQIFEAYLNYAPYGGNVVGVGAASLVYLRKPVQQLTLPEAINLAVIPQNPRKRLPNNQFEPDNLVAARQRLAKLWMHQHPMDKRLAGGIALKVVFQQRQTLTFEAPHLVEYLLRTTTDRQIHAALDLKMQNVVERVITEYLKSRRDVGINNAAAMLLDTETMQVKALMGSADYANSKIEGQVNGTLGKRSPGSTLKPFIYALALDQGLVHSASILKDAPSNFGVFTPENFDGRFNGPISVQDALIRSRNIPAVALASRLRSPNLYDFLKLAKVQKLQSESHYGLALVLGGGEVTMEELAQLYAILPNQGEWHEIQYLKNSKIDEKQSFRLLSSEASFIVLDMLRQTTRPDTYSVARPAIAWKTGTSWGFRDAWTAGVFGRYVLVVWVGNFDGASNPALIGVEAAAPPFLRIVDAIRAEKLDAGETIFTQPPDLKRIEVCAASGDLPNKECPVKTQAWFIAGKSPIKQSTLHRSVLIDSRTGKMACQPNAFTHTEVYEYWPSDMQNLFKRAGMSLRQPPIDVCGAMNGLESADRALSITSPLRSVTHLTRLDRKEPILLRAEAGANSGNLHWFVNNALLGQAKPGETISWYPSQVGKYMLRVVDADGRADSREVTIELVN